MAEQLNANDRLTFMLSLVPFLIDVRSAPVDEIADRFGVSPKLVRDTAEMLAMVGVPGDGYMHNDLFDIDWDDLEERDTVTLTYAPTEPRPPRLSSREAAALIAALQYLASLPANRNSAAIAALTAKLALGASASPSRIVVAGFGDDPMLTAISGAVDAGVQLSFDYLNSRGETLRRTVDPLRVVSQDNTWYLKGWCHLRNGLRTFRLDQINGLEVSDTPIPAETRELLVSNRLFEGSESDLVALIDVDPAAGAFLGEYLPESGRSSRHHDVAVAHFHGLKRIAAANAGLVSVLAPPEARRVTADWALEALAQYPDRGAA